MKETWIVFYNNGTEIGAYTQRGTFAGEMEDTILLLATANGISPENIDVVAEIR